tara:strand:+ start:82 stop:495 length:414 start_codon:yes stop_codon:yes gene_type:complete
MQISKKLVQDVHRIVNEGNKPLTPEMKKKVKERAFELADKLTNVDEDKVAVILTRMAMSGDDLDDLEALESELKMNESTSSHSERFPNKYKNMSLQELKKEKAKLEKGFKDSDRGGIEYETLESQIRSLDMLIKKAK